MKNRIWLVLALAAGAIGFAAKANVTYYNCYFYDAETGVLIGALHGVPDPVICDMYEPHGTHGTKSEHETVIVEAEGPGPQ